MIPRRSSGESWPGLGSDARRSWMARSISCCNGAVSNCGGVISSPLFREADHPLPFDLLKPWGDEASRHSGRLHTSLHRPPPGDATPHAVVRPLHCKARDFRRNRAKYATRGTKFPERGVAKALAFG